MEKIVDFFMATNVWQMLVVGWLMLIYYKLPDKK